MQYCWINQKGAGTGKTWACVGLLKSMPQFETYIYLSKMNTAKAVIKGEFVSQYGEHNIRFENDVAIVSEEALEEFGEPVSEGNTRGNSKVIVSTIDSMIYAFSNREIRKYTKENYYSELVHSFDVDFPRFEDGDSVWPKVDFSPNVLVVIDECQDLEEGYIDCFMSSLATKGVSFYLMGDILQSVVEQNNIFCYLRDGKHLAPGKFPEGLCFEHIDNSNDKIIRFHSTKFVDLANKIVDFVGFGANEIKSCCEAAPCGFSHGNTPFFLVEQSGRTDELFELLEGIVMDNDYGPEDILFISPIIDSWFMYQLEDEINEFWADYYDDIANYQGKYCMLQTSKYGKIDIEMSTGKTRVLSVHAAKGMGATCVVVVNLLDRALRSHQTQNGELKYESMVHVALTRQKENLLVYYNGANVKEDILAKDILDVVNALPVVPTQKRCNIPVETLYSALKGTQAGLCLVNEFEENNFIRSRLGRIGTVDFPFRYLEPIDVKIHLMMNTMIKILSLYWDDTEFKYLKPCLKRLSILESITVIVTEDPIRFSIGDRILELPIGLLSGSLLAIVSAVRKKLTAWKRYRETRKGEEPTELCFLEAYVLLYLIGKISPFTVIQVGNIYHRMARSANQGCRSEYHPTGICSCLDHLDVIIEREKEEPVQWEMEFLDFGENDPFGSDPFEDLFEDSPEEILENTREIPRENSLKNSRENSRENTPTPILPTSNVDSIYSILPQDGERPDGFGAAMISQFDDTLDYKPNFSINLGMSDFYSTRNSMNVVLTVPYINYVNFMEEITLPILVHAYLIFKANSKTRGAPFGLMLKQFFGMRRDTSVIDRIVFYINRLDNDDRRVVTILRDDEFFSRVNKILTPVVTKAFGSFVDSWITYYRKLQRGMSHYTKEEIADIKKTNRLTGDILDEIKDVPSEIVGMILDAIEKPNFANILKHTVAKIGEGFGRDEYVAPP